MSLLVKNVNLPPFFERFHSIRERLKEFQK